MRVERGESRGAPARNLAAVIAPRTTHFRHPLKDLRTLVRRGVASSRGRNALFFFFVRSFVRTIVTVEAKHKRGLVALHLGIGLKPINGEQEEEECIEFAVATGKPTQPEEKYPLN